MSVPGRIDEFLVVADATRGTVSLVLVDVDTGGDRPDGNEGAVIFLGGFGIAPRLSRRGLEFELVSADPRALDALVGKAHAAVVETRDGRILRSYRADLF